MTEKVAELTKKLKAYSKARKDLIAENDELKKQKDSMVSQMAEKQSELMNEKAQDDEKLTLLQQEKSELIEKLEVAIVENEKNTETLTTLEKTLEDRRTTETELTTKLTSMSESLGGETEKAKKYKALAEKFKKISTELKKRNETLTAEAGGGDAKIKDQINELQERENSMRTSLGVLDKENETLRAKIEEAESSLKNANQELESMRSSHAAKLGENEVLKAEIDQLKTNLDGQSARLQQCRDEYEEEVNSLKTKNSELTESTKSELAEINQKCVTISKERDDAVQSKEYLQSYLNQLEEREKAESEKFERSRRESVGIISTLESRVKSSDQQVALFVERTASLENSIQKLQDELKKAENERQIAQPVAENASSGELEKLRGFEAEFNRQAKVTFTFAHVVCILRFLGFC